MSHLHTCMDSIYTCTVSLLSSVFALIFFSYYYIVIIIIISHGCTTTGVTINILNLESWIYTMKAHFWLSLVDLQGAMTTLPRDTVKHLPDNGFFSWFVWKKQYKLYNVFYCFKTGYIQMWSLEEEWQEWGNLSISLKHFLVQVGTVL